MAEINYDVLSEDEAVTAASLNDRFTEVQGGANALEQYAFAKGALGAQHLPAIADLLGTKTVGEDFTAGGFGSTVWSWPSSGLTTMSIGGSSLEMTSSTDFTAFRLGMNEASGERYAGVLVLANVHFYHAQIKFDVGGVSTLSDFPYAAVVGVQFRANSVWYTVERATRVCDARMAFNIKPTNDCRTLQDIPIATMITAADLSAASLPYSTQITGIRIVVGGYTPYNMSALPGNTQNVYLREGRLTALRVRASGLHGGT